jgi:hypothetical protein
MWWAYAIAAYFLGLPAGGGAIVGALAAALVVMDPTGAFWGPKTGISSPARPAESLGATVSSR